MNEITPKPRPRWYQASLREVALVITLICFGFGWFQERHRRIIHDGRFRELVSVLEWAQSHPKWRGKQEVYVYHEGHCYDVAIQSVEVDPIFLRMGFGR